MNREILRMQMLAGLITESQYKLKLDEYGESHDISWNKNNLTELLTKLFNKISKDDNYSTEYEIDGDEYETEYNIKGEMGNEVIYTAIIFDQDKKLAYLLSDECELELHDYYKGDGTTGPGMGSLGEFKYIKTSPNIDVEVYENINDLEEIHNSDKPLFTFKYENPDLYMKIFDNETIENQVRKNILNYNPY